MLSASGRNAVAAGNDAVPLVDAIDDPDVELFVVEASSFTLGHTERFTPQVATWLNFAPDHLDVHRSVEAYEQAKASIWRELAPDGVAVANADDPVVMRNRNQTRRAITFSTAVDADYRLADGELLGPHGEADHRGARALASDAPRRGNALAAAATAVAAGAASTASTPRCATSAGLPHRVEFVGESDGIRWYDDSKATVPHATLPRCAASTPSC